MKSAITGSLMLGLLAAMVWPTLLLAQTVAQPEIGYIFPPGGRAGETVDVVNGRNMRSRFQPSWIWKRLTIA